MPKIQILEFCNKCYFTRNTPSEVKLLDKMYKYEMGPASIVEDTERTWFRPQMNGRKDKWMDEQHETSIPPFYFVEAGVY